MCSVSQMGFYQDRILPRLVDLSCANAGMERPRRRALAGLSGRVVEVGFGSGPNIGLYPDEVTEVLAVEPSQLARDRAMRRIESSTVPVTFIGLDGERLPLEAASCDSALVTFTLCTIPDVGAALSEMYRVLRPGGRLHLLEHGAAPRERTRRWQIRLEPLQKRVAGGCHLTREPAALVRDAGFEIVELDERFLAGPKPWTWVTTAVAQRPVDT